MRKEPFLIAFSIILYLSGHLALARKLEPAMGFFYVTSWWSYIIFLDSMFSWRSGRSLFLNRSLPTVMIISCGYWCAFELVNLRLENWFYVNVPHGVSLRYTGYFLAYGTVIPAIAITASMVSPLFSAFRIKPVRIKHYPVRAISCGIVLFLLAMIFPKYLFGLAWVFAIPLIDGINCRAGYRSFMGDLGRGEIGRLLCALLSGLICGILWETWNSLSPVRWVYTVPFLEHMKVFEMPLPGYIGFLVFGVETMAFVDLLEGLRQKRAAFALTLCLAFLIAAVSFAFIDRHTVFSRTTPIERLSFLTRQSMDVLIASGARTNLGIDTRVLDPGEADKMKLINMKGLGYENYLKLESNGISNIRDLGRLDDASLSRMLGEKNLLRVRVYQAAAQAH